MNAELQERADTRFQSSLAERGARDPREFYRGLLRELKEADPEAYATMVEAWRTEVIEPIAGDEGDPLELWIRFGIRLAATLHPGQTVAVAEDGRRVPHSPPGDAGHLLLHFPDRARTRAIPLGIPVEPSAAQRATLDLLVNGKTKLQE
jgi:hypothetical protein